MVESGTTATGGSLELFSRRSSGLVRELSVTDAAWYGVLAAGALFILLFVFPLPQAFFPGLSLPVSSLLAMVLMPFVFVVYAGLGSAMPRMGGDYLFQTRSIHPAVGFSFTFAWSVFMWVTFTVTGGLVVATAGFQPFLLHLGVRQGSEGLISLADWFGSANGTFLVILVLIGLSFLTTAYGIGFYRMVQRYFIVPAAVIAGAFMIILFARSSASFFANFNAFHLEALGVSNYADTVRQAAADAGHQDPGFSWKYTFLFLSVSGAAMWYLVYSTQGLLGEIKEASSFHKLLKAFSIGGLFLGLYFWVIPTWLFERTVTREFMHEYATAWAAGTIEAPAGGSMISFAMMMTSNPLILFLVALGFVAMGYYFSTCVFLNMTRVLMAMGMDRTLPSWFAGVNERYHAPVNAAIFFGAMAVGLNVLFHFNEDVFNAVIFGGIFTSGGMIALGGLAGALFAFRARGVYEVSPVAQYKVLGLPLITVCGVVTFLGAGSVTIMNLIFPELGFTTGWARAFLVGSVFVSLVWFYARRGYLKQRQGIELDLAFAQVPPA